MTDVSSQVAAKLAELGYPTVLAFQQAKGLSADGVAGQNTLKALGLGDLFKLSLGPGQTQLDTKNTPLTPAQAAQALSAGYQAVTGAPPTPQVLGLLMAQSGTETGNWSKLPNYNFGGIKMTSGTPFVQAFITPEGAGAAQKLYVLGFAAYQNAADGAAAYIRVLKARAPWWTGLQSGVPSTYVDSLVSIPNAHYFTADPAAYLAALNAKLAQFADLAKEYARQLSATERVALQTVAASSGMSFIESTRAPVLGGLLGGALGRLLFGGATGAVFGGALGLAIGAGIGFRVWQKFATMRAQPRLTSGAIQAGAAPGTPASLVVQAAAALAAVDPCLKANEQIVRNFQSAAGLGVDGRYGPGVAAALKRYQPNAPPACSPRPAWWGASGTSANS